MKSKSKSKYLSLMNYKGKEKMAQQYKILDKQ